LLKEQSEAGEKGRAKEPQVERQGGREETGKE